MSLIELSSLRHEYSLPTGDTVQALQGINLSVEEGEFVAIAGANGSGKTTLALHLNGLLVPTAGTALIAGLDTADQGAGSEVRRRVSMVFQSPDDQIVATVVEEDVAFGPENLGVSETELPAVVRDALEQVGMWRHRHRPPHQLSEGQKQRVAIAGALAMKPQCLVLDEVTAMLDPAGSRDIARLIQELNREGMTIVTVTHKMEEALQAPRLVVLSGGKVVADGPPDELLGNEDPAVWNLRRPPVAELAVRLSAGLTTQLPLTAEPAELAAALAGILGGGRRVSVAPVRADAAPTAAAEPVIQVSGLRHEYMKGTPLAQLSLDEITFQVGAGEAFALIGPTGSGKSTLLAHLNGLETPQSGSVRVLEVSTGHARADLTGLRRRVGLVLQNPGRQLFERYVGDDVAFGARLAGIDGPDLTARVRWAMEQVGLDFASYRDRPVLALSGGERRRVGLAGVLVLQPDVLLLDEPAAGLDPAAHEELIETLGRLHDGGMTLVMATHTMEDVVALCDRVLVLQEGRVAAAGTVREIFAGPESVRLSGMGLELPGPARVVRALMDRGVLPASDALTVSEAERAIFAAVEGVR